LRHSLCWNGLCMSLGKRAEMAIKSSASDAIMRTDILRVR